MMKSPEYIIVAGINGAGKSTMYEMSPKMFEGTERLNADEILRASGGDWHNDADNFNAMRTEVVELHEALNKQKSVHVETTLAGNGHAQLKLIDLAHANGFVVTLIYVALDSSDRAIRRVRHRVETGGHGVEPGLIEKRYAQSLKNLSTVAANVDIIKIYDNSSNEMRPVYARKEKIETVNNLADFPWIKLNINDHTSRVNR